MTSASVAAQRLGGGKRAASRGDEAAGWSPRRLLRQMSRIRPLKVLTIGAFSVALVGIVANAVVFQKGHHPAPLFGSGQTIAMGQAAHPSEPVAPAPPQPRVATAAAQTAPAADITGTAALDNAAPVQVAAPPRSGPQKHAAAKPHHGDGIGDLLNAGSASDNSGAAAPGATPAKKPDPALMAAQKKLMKLGYAVKPDGRMSAGMHRALAQFERDHHLKSEAAMSPRLQREIATATPAPETTTKTE